MEIISAVVILAVCIVQIALFVKIWGMTNDIKEIKDVILEYSNTKKDNKGNFGEIDGFSIGDLVINKDNGKQMRIRKYNSDSNKFSCYSNGDVTYDGDFYPSQIELFK